MSPRAFCQLSTVGPTTAQPHVGYNCGELSGKLFLLQLLSLQWQLAAMTITGSLVEILCSGSGTFSSRTIPATTTIAPVSAAQVVDCSSDNMNIVIEEGVTELSKLGGHSLPGRPTLQTSGFQIPGSSVSPSTLMTAFEATEITAVPKLAGQGLPDGAGLQCPRSCTLARDIMMPLQAQRFNTSMAFYTSLTYYQAISDLAATNRTSSCAIFKIRSGHSWDQHLLNALVTWHHTLLMPLHSGHEFLQATESVYIQCKVTHYAKPLTTTPLPPWLHQAYDQGDGVRA
ncbi:deleted in malignant brain tumors 1 protein isoform X1 [Lates japonicus]|uniref:Deleted in malignant brain tumors 1 protein isoform X1 n=1 Tax=Lates japonicus TaxID=270547 RepID=A0AAD3RN63_LATJO|nr:deleted in malignant brain tumors 1 protein isoform X1 [Lates japonicus]